MVSDTERAIDATRFLLKAVRTARTYPRGNEICQRALAELLPHLKPALPLELGVTPQGLQIAGQSAVEEEDTRAKVSALLFRDGIRRLELKPGLAADEVERLVVALAENIHPDDLSRDYVTLLWEADLPHVVVGAVDPFLDLDGEEDIIEGKPPEAQAEKRDNSEQDLPPPPKEAFWVSEADTLRLDHEVSLADAVGRNRPLPIIPIEQAKQLGNTAILRIEQKLELGVRIGAVSLRKNDDIGSGLRDRGMQVVGGHVFELRHRDIGTFGIPGQIA